MSSSQSQITHQWWLKNTRIVTSTYHNTVSGLETLSEYDNMNGWGGAE
jgi:hypothetical protein